MSNVLIAVLPVMIIVSTQNHLSLSPCLMEKMQKKKKSTEADIDLTYTCGVINNFIIVDSKYDEIN